jgi:hypothetical protein
VKAEAARRIEALRKTTSASDEPFAIPAAAPWERRPQTLLLNSIRLARWLSDRGTQISNSEFSSGCSEFESSYDFRDTVDPQTMPDAAPADDTKTQSLLQGLVIIVLEAALKASTVVELSTIARTPGLSAALVDAVVLTAAASKQAYAARSIGSSISPSTGPYNGPYDSRCSELLGLVSVALDLGEGGQGCFSTAVQAEPASNRLAAVLQLCQGIKQLLLPEKDGRGNNNSSCIVFSRASSFSKEGTSDVFLAPLLAIHLAATRILLTGCNWRHPTCKCSSKHMGALPPHCRCQLLPPKDGSACEVVKAVLGACTAAVDRVTLWWGLHDVELWSAPCAAQVQGLSNRPCIS